MAMAGKKKVMTASEAAKKAHKGMDLGAKGKGFANIVTKAKSKYSVERAKKIAGAQFQKMRKRGQL